MKCTPPPNKDCTAIRDLADKENIIIDLCSAIMEMSSAWDEYPELYQLVGTMQVANNACKQAGMPIPFMEIYDTEANHIAELERGYSQDR